MFHSLVMVSAALCYGAMSAQAFVPISASRFFAQSFTAAPLPSPPAMVTSSSEDISSFSEVTSAQTDVVKVRIPKPLGIVLEELSVEDSKGGVGIVEVNPQGNAAKYGRSSSVTMDDGPLLCVRDKVLAVNGEDVSTAAFDTVMEKIIASDLPVVELTLQRPQNSVVVAWDNGVSVAAQPGEYLGNVASEAGMKIHYSCRSGSCGTCEQSVDLNNGKEQRYCRPCSSRVPKGVQSMRATPSDRFLSF
jgi:ferredoxin